jgi:xylulokinase
VLLAIDLGSTVTKAVVWGSDGPLGTGRSVLRTELRAEGIAEQDPSGWWHAVVAACREALASLNEPVSGIVFSAARQTFVAVNAELRPLGPGIMWSDRRAPSEARALAEGFGGGREGIETLRRRTGMVLDSGAPAAKLAWLDRHEPDLLREARWILAPRDLVAARMTGEVATDETLAQSSGLYDSELCPVPELIGDHPRLLPPVIRPSTVTGGLLPGPAAEIGLEPGTPVVIGAGDRACEVLGTGARPERPMVSWGTTANVSVPLEAWPDWDKNPFAGTVVSRGAAGGFLVEAGLSSAGSFVDWLARIGATDVDALLELAADSTPGAGGVTAVCWLGGARAPWWRDDARAAFVGLSPEHTIGDLARAAVESVAFEVARCIEAVSPGPSSIAMAGGSLLELWPEILCGVTGLGATRRRSGLAACAGAALLAAQATGFAAELDSLDPPTDAVVPDPVLVGIYRAVRDASDSAAAAALGIAGRSGS